MSDTIEIAELNSKLLGVVLHVKMKSEKEPMPEHPNPDKQKGGDFFIVDYIGKNEGVREVDNVESLVLEITQGAREKVAVPLDKIEDVSIHVPRPAPSFPVSALSRNPGKEKVS